MPANNKKTTRSRPWVFNMIPSLGSLERNHYLVPFSATRYRWARIHNPKSSRPPKSEPYIPTIKFNTVDKVLFVGLNYWLVLLYILAVRLKHVTRTARR